MRNTRLHPNQHEPARKKSLTANPDNPTQPHSKPPNPQNPRNTKTRKSYVLHPEDTLRKPGKSKENTSTWYPWIRGPMKSRQRRLDLSIPSGSSCVKGEKKGSLCVCVYIYTCVCVHIYIYIYIYIHIYPNIRALNESGFANRWSTVWSGIDFEGSQTLGLGVALGCRCWGLGFSFRFEGFDLGWYIPV